MIMKSMAVRLKSNMLHITSCPGILVGVAEGVAAGLVGVVEVMVLVVVEMMGLEEVGVVDDLKLLLVKVTGPALIQIVII
jgi:hypothetical protein